MSEGIYALSGMALGSIATVVAALVLARQQRETLLTQFRTENSTEALLVRLLFNKSNLSITFKEIEKSVGGFEGDELRRLLVRAGAKRVETGENEQWILLVREKQYIAHLRRNEKVPRTPWGASRLVKWWHTRIRLKSKESASAADRESGEVQTKSPS